MRTETYPPGWSCELIAIRLELYLGNALPHLDALAVAEHLEMCTRCAALLAAIQLVSGGSLAAPPDRPRKRHASLDGAGARRGGKREGGRRDG